MTKVKTAIGLACLLVVILAIQAHVYLLRREADEFCRARGYVSGTRGLTYTDGYRVWSTDSAIICVGEPPAVKVAAP